MMNRLILISLFAVLVVPAWAQGKPETKASISTADCQKLLKRQVRHTARPDVAYQPGVDVRGKKVVGADTGDTPQIKLPKKIVINFGLDLAGKYGVEGSGYHDATTTLFPIEYDLASGGLTINGQRMDQGDSQAVIDACQRMLNQ